MEKSPEAFRTIREVADTMDLPQHVLRFWETRFPQVKPLKRAGGRRYYRPDDVERLKVIKRLLYEEGYTIKGVQKLFREQGARALTSGDVATFALAAEFPPVGSGSAAPLSGEQDDRENFGANGEAKAPFAGRPAIGEGELARLREALASLRQAERLLLRARTGEG